MKEIDINIEGYNVNGICVGCLNYNRKMFYRDEVKECFKLLGNIDVPDGLNIQVCWECLAAVNKVCQFQKQILNAYDVLINYSKKHTFLDSPSHFIKHATDRLNTVPVDSIDITDTQEKVEVEINFDDVKEEVDADLKFDDDLVETKDEPFMDTVLYESSQEQDITSEDEDIQLSKLKRKKERKKKSKNDKKPKEKTKEDTSLEQRIARKLKNLPTEIVELYTMSEEEMWQVRSADVDNKDFARSKYKCMDCIIEFNTEKLMNDHMAGKHKPKSEECDQCDVCKSYMLTKDKLSVHRSLHLTAYRCRQCDARTTLKRLMSVHVVTHEEAVDIFKCNTCEKKFSTKSKLSYHRSSCEQERPQCDCCGKVFASKMTLKYHLNQKSPKEHKVKEKLYIPCKGCNKVFTSKKSYRAHVVIHDGQSYPCPICGKLFLWKRNLARHTRNHRERDAGALHECRECGKTFSSRDCYNNHMRLSKKHVGSDSYVHECNYCGKKFPSKWCMVDHIDWDHLKRIKYQCSVCFKAFKTAKIMVAHMNNIHEGRKNREPDGEHLCEICGKSYKTVKRLKGHVWAMHTNRSTTKSYKCKLCPATFTWQTSIYKHMKMMHETKRAKPSRLAAKRLEPYTEISRMQYFQHNLVVNLPTSIIPPDLN